MKSCKIWGRTFSALVLGIILFAENSSFARTRAEVLDTAKIYADLPWKPTTYNLLDVKNHRDNITEGDETKIDGSDGIDDRAFKWDDSLNPPQWVFSTRNWPFGVCSTCTYHGEAYAFGQWNTTETFKSSLALENPKWIAGKRSGDALPANYAGFTGLDCSGFVSRLLVLRRHYSTLELPGYGLAISTGALKRGDFLDRMVIEMLAQDGTSGEEILPTMAQKIKSNNGVTREAVMDFLSGQIKQGNIKAEKVRPLLESAARNETEKALKEKAAKILKTIE